jgi:hypothetical protein
VTATSDRCRFGGCPRTCERGRTRCVTHRRYAGRSPPGRGDINVFAPQQHDRPRPDADVSHRAALATVWLTREADDRPAGDARVLLGMLGLEAL